MGLNVEVPVVALVATRYMQVAHTDLTTSLPQVIGAFELDSVIGKAYMIYNVVSTVLHF